MAEENTGGQAQAPREEGGHNRKKRSAVWEHFESFTDADGEDKAKCKNCHAELVADSKRHGTRHLMRHIESCEEQGRGRRRKRPTSPPPRAAPRESPNCSMPEPDREEATADLARMIALHGYDPSIVEDSYFRSFISRLNPDFQVPSRAAIEAICDGIFDEAKRDLKSQLERSSGKVSLALNKAETVEGTVACVACHFIDDEWNCHEMILDAYMVVPPRHFAGGPVLGIPQNEDVPPYNRDFADNTAEDYGISRRILSVTDIDGRIVMKTDYELGEVGEYMDEYDGGSYVDRVLHSIARCFHDILGTYFTEDDYLSDYQDQFWSLPRQKRAEVLSQLGLDDIGAYKEDWYSIYCSLQVFGKYSSGFSHFTLLCKIWGEIYRAIKTVSDPNRAASNLCLRELFKVRELLQTELEGASAVDEDSDYFDDKHIIRALCRAEDILDREMQEIYLEWSIALVLDPRYKLEYIKFSFKRAFGSNSENNISKVTTYIKDLFTQYSKHGGGTTDGDPNHAIEMAVHSADPLEQAWDEHCRLQDSVSEIDSYLQPDTELNLYLRDRRVPRTEGFDILNWWKVNSSKYPTVARMARDYLAMPTCSKLSSEQISQIRSMVRGYSKQGYQLFVCYDRGFRNVKSSRAVGDRLID